MLFEPREPAEIRGLNPATLAFVGDAVFELMVRERLAQAGSLPAHELHRQAVRLVCARAQSAVVDAILPLLNEEEAAFYRRGRNASSLTVPKNVPSADYRRATGFECVFGYLGLIGDLGRARELFEVAWSIGRKEKNGLPEGSPS